MDRHILNWHEYFMNMAEIALKKSKDRSTNVGAVIVGDGQVVISVGYNGFPRGVNDNVESRHQRPDKYLYTEHAERNAIYSAARNGVKLKNSIIYVTGGGSPCADCARGIIQSGIKLVCTIDGKFSGKGPWEDSINAGRIMFGEAGVAIVYLNSDYQPIKILTTRSRFYTVSRMDIDYSDCEKPFKSLEVVSDVTLEFSPV